jgi:hypothetical protein
LLAGISFSKDEQSSLNSFKKDRIKLKNNLFESGLTDMVTSSSRYSKAFLSLVLPVNDERHLNSYLFL